MAQNIDKKFAALRKYSASDVSDTLLQIQSVPAGSPPYAGYLGELIPYPPTAEPEIRPKIVGYASTFKFISKNEPTPDDIPAENAIPPGTHWVDSSQPDTIALLDQPVGQRCAILGGIMATRMKVLGVRAVVVNGRVRDMAELKKAGLSVWGRGQSTVGAGAEAKAVARNVPIDVGGVTVNPGDILFCDPLEGVVVIPQALLDEVLSLMPKLVAADDWVKEDVANGSKVFDAFKKHRGT